MEKLISLRDNIEKLEKHQHIHIVKIIKHVRVCICVCVYVIRSINESLTVI